MFLEYSLAVKRETIQELKEIADQKDKELTLAEEAVKKNASTFNKFLKDCNIRLMETMKAAEEEVKAKQKTTAEMKEIQRQIMAVKSDISRNEEDLEEYNMYRDFLLKLSPPEWQEKQRIRKETAEKIKAPPKEWDLSTVSSPQPAQAVQPANRQNTESSYLLTTTKSQTPPQQNIPTEEGAEPKTLPDSEGEDLEDFEDPQVYFTDHQQVLDIFESMAANNVKAIEKLAEEEETVEGLQSTGDLRFKKMEQEAAQLGRQIVILRETLRREIAKSADLKVKAKLFSFGEYKAEDQDLMLEKLRKKVSEVYRNCLGLGDGGQSAVQMLSTIEWRLYELLEQIEAVPRDVVLLVERAQAKERRVREREARAHLEKLAREELQRKMMARAMADIKKPAEESGWTWTSSVQSWKLVEFRPSRLSQNPNFVFCVGLLFSARRFLNS
ncbi:hypothetical protein NFI96_004571 [Prochilodus magdalenae]|nr:hypothetical protein NFI96_004571 [Prochilodus magdalenae]